MADRIIDERCKKAEAGLNELGLGFGREGISEAVVYFMSQGRDMSRARNLVRACWTQARQRAKNWINQMRLAPKKPVSIELLTEGSTDKLGELCSLLRIVGAAGVGGVEDLCDEIVRFIKTEYLLASDRYIVRPAAADLYKIVRCDLLRERVREDILDFLHRLYTIQHDDGCWLWDIWMDPDSAPFSGISHEDVISYSKGLAGQDVLAALHRSSADVLATASIICATAMTIENKEWSAQANSAANWLMRSQQADGHFRPEIPRPVGPEPKVDHTQLEADRLRRSPLETTCVALMALSLLNPKPLGWESSVRKAKDWLLSQQNEDGLWLIRQYDSSWLEPTWVTVLVLDALSLADGDHNTTFKIPEHLRADIRVQKDESKSDEKPQRGAHKARPKRDVLWAQVNEFGGNIAQVWKKYYKDTWGRSTVYKWCKDFGWDLEAIREGDLDLRHRRPET